MTGIISEKWAWPHSAVESTLFLGMPAWTLFFLSTLPTLPFLAPKDLRDEDAEERVPMQPPLRALSADPCHLGTGQQIPGEGLTSYLGASVHESNWKEKDSPLKLRWKSCSAELYTVGVGRRKWHGWWHQKLQTQTSLTGSNDWQNPPCVLFLNWPTRLKTKGKKLSFKLKYQPP